MEHAVRSSLDTVAGRDRYGLLLALLLGAFLLSGAGDLRWVTLVGTVLNLCALVLGFRVTGLWSHRRRLAAVAGIGVVASICVTVLPATSVGGALGALGQALMLGAVLVAVVRSVLAHERVEISTILGAIVGYFLVGMMFAWIYLAMRGFYTGPVLDPDEPGLPSYYSFVVLSTLGFGDITPAQEFVGRVTAIEAISGQIFLATLVARLVSLYGSDRHRSTATGDDAS